MTARRPIDVHAAILAVTFATAAAVLFFVALSVLAKPGGYAFGLAQARRQTAEAEHLLLAPGDPYAFSTGATCHDTPAMAAAAFRQRVQAAAGATTVTISSLTVAPGAVDEALGGLAPVSVQLEASGGYDAVLALLASLSKSQPEVFLDTVDLRSQTSAVALKLSGRVFCSPSVRL